MAVEGTLDLFQLPEILQIIAQEQKTGILTVQGESDIVAVSFLHGKVVAADALNQTLEEGLGEVLLERGLLNPEKLEVATTEQKRSGGRLIDILVESGALERALLMDALRAQTFGLLEDLLGWREGEFKFYTGDEVSYEEGFVPIGVEELLLHALREQEPEPGLAAEADGDQLIAGFGEISFQESEPVEGPGGRGADELLLMPPVVPEPAAPVIPEPVAPPPVAEKALRPEPPRAPEPARVPEVSAVARAAFRAVPSEASGWWGGVLGFLGALALVALLVSDPAGLLMPSPASGPERAAFQQGRLEARYARIDAALKTYYLLERNHPEDLHRLVELGLLEPRDLRGPDGGSIDLQVEEGRYRVGLSAGDGGRLEGSLEGDFLLDPDLPQGRDESGAKPLVLLD